MKEVVKLLATVTTVGGIFMAGFFCFIPEAGASAVQGANLIAAGIGFFIKEIILS